MKKWQIPFLLLLIAGTAFIIRRHNAPSVVPFQAEEGYIFGTIYHAKYQYATSLHEEILQELNTVDASLSMFNPQSCISRINRGEDIPADSLITTLFRQASAISEATDGAFDITVAPLVNAWGFGIKHDALPDSATVDSLRALVGWQRVRLQDGRLQRDDSRMIFDFSAIAKGFGADCVAQLFERRGIHNYMIEIGGEIVCHGTNPQGEQWKIGINKPNEENDAPAPDLQAILHYDTEFFKAFASVGPYAGWRWDIHRTGPRVTEGLEDSFKDTDIRRDFGLKGGVGFGIVFDPFEFHIEGQVKWAWSSLYEPDWYSPYYYRFAYPLDIVITAGIHYQLSRRTGRTRKELRKEAYNSIYGNTDSTSR